MATHNDKRVATVSALRPLLDLRRLDRQVRECRDSEAGGDLATEDTDRELVDWLIEEAAARLPGLPASCDLDLVAISPATLWDGVDDRGEIDVEPMARLCGTVTLQGGSRVGLVIEVWGEQWAYVCRDVPTDLRAEASADEEARS